MSNVSCLSATACFDLPVNYSLADLNHMNVDEVRALTTLVPSDTQQEAVRGGSRDGDR